MNDSWFYLDDRKIIMLDSATEPCLWLKRILAQAGPSLAGEGLTLQYLHYHQARVEVSTKPIHELTLLHSERPKLYAILVFLSAIGLRRCVYKIILTKKILNFYIKLLCTYLDLKENH